jgi:serine/threonine protein kinase
LLAGRYRLTEQLPGAGMSRIWRAHDDLLDRPIAAKEITLPSGLTESEHEDVCRLLLREMRRAARLRHPGIMTVHDVVEQHGQPWTVMEFLPSQGLDELIHARGSLPPLGVASIGLRVLQALGAAHAEGVQHGDVNPSHILLAHDGRLVLSDFGTAPYLGEAARLILGSPDFLAPERARGAEATGMASDLWSLGATLYTAVEAALPFSRKGALQTLTAIVLDEPPPPSRAGPLRPVIEGLLVKDPMRRLDAGSVQNMLEQVVRDVPAASLPWQRSRETASGVRSVTPVSAFPLVSAPRPSGPARSLHAEGTTSNIAAPPASPSATGASQTEPAEAQEAMPATPSPGRVEAESAGLGGGAAAAPVSGEPRGPAQITGGAPGAGVPRPWPGDARDPQTAVEPDGVTSRPETSGRAEIDEQPDADERPGINGRAEERPPLPTPPLPPWPPDASSGGDPEADPTPNLVIAAAEVHDPEVAAALAAFEAALSAPRAAKTAAQKESFSPAEPAVPPPQATRDRAVATPAQPAGATVADVGNAGGPRVSADASGMPTAPESATAAGPATDPTAPAAGGAESGRPDAPARAVTHIRAIRPPTTSPPAELTDQGSRRRSLLAVAVLVLAALGAVLIPVLVGRDEPAGSAGPAASPVVPPEPQATDRAGNSSSTATSSPEPAATPPAGFGLHQDPTGFSIAVPEGWTVSRDGGLVDFRDPDSTRFLRVDQRSNPRTDPYEDWLARSKALAPQLPGYELKRISLVGYRGWPAADWEYLWSPSGQDRQHVLIRNVVSSRTRGYALYFSAPDRTWTTDLRIFDVFTRTFSPAEK